MIVHNSQREPAQQISFRAAARDRGVAPSCTTLEAVQVCAPPSTCWVCGCKCWSSCQ